MTAPTDRQIKNIMFPEITKIYNKIETDFNPGQDQVIQRTLYYRKQPPHTFQVHIPYIVDPQFRSTFLIRVAEHITIVWIVVIETEQAGGAMLRVSP